MPMTSYEAYLAHRERLMTDPAYALAHAAEERPYPGEDYEVERDVAREAAEQIAAWKQQATGAFAAKRAELQAAGLLDQDGRLPGT